MTYWSPNFNPHDFSDGYSSPNSYHPLTSSHSDDLDEASFASCSTDHYENPTPSSLLSDDDDESLISPQPCSSSMVSIPLVGPTPLEEYELDFIFKLGSNSHMRTKLSKLFKFCPSLTYRDVSSDTQIQRMFEDTEDVQKKEEIRLAQNFLKLKASLYKQQTEENQHSTTKEETLFKEIMQSPLDVYSLNLFKNIVGNYRHNKTVSQEKILNDINEIESRLPHHPSDMLTTLWRINLLRMKAEFRLTQEDLNAVVFSLKEISDRFSQPQIKLNFHYRILEIWLKHKLNDRVSAEMTNASQFIATLEQNGHLLEMANLFYRYKYYEEAKSYANFVLVQPNITATTIAKAKFILGQVHFYENNFEEAQRYLTYVTRSSGLTKRITSEAHLSLAIINDSLGLCTYTNLSNCSSYFMNSRKNPERQADFIRLNHHNDKKLASIKKSKLSSEDKIHHYLGYLDNCINTMTLMTTKPFNGVKTALKEIRILRPKGLVIQNKVKRVEVQFDYFNNCNEQLKDKCKKYLRLKELSETDHSYFTFAINAIRLRLNKSVKLATVDHYLEKSFNDPIMFSAWLMLKMRHNNLSANRVNPSIKTELTLPNFNFSPSPIYVIEFIKHAVTITCFSPLTFEDKCTFYDSGLKLLSIKSLGLSDSKSKKYFKDFISTLQSFIRKELHDSPELKTRFVKQLATCLYVQSEYKDALNALHISHLDKAALFKDPSLLELFISIKMMMHSKSRDLIHLVDEFLGSGIEPDVFEYFNLIRDRLARY